MRSRLIPVLQLDRNRRLVKTLRFGERVYVGDPFNVVRLFNEKEVDEICIVDIDASVDGRAADAGFISELASECFMPLSYGGGINRKAPIDVLARNGVEKFVIGSVDDDIDFVSGLAADLGRQAVVSCIDYRADGRVYTRSGTKMRPRTPLDQARMMVDAGAGEIVLQSIDRDGTRGGMDLAMISAVSHQLDVPLVALGGASNVDHLSEALDAGASAAASGSAFTFIGRLRAVLINYPTLGTIGAK